MTLFIHSLISIRNMVALIIIICGGINCLSLVYQDRKISTNPSSWLENTSKGASILVVALSIVLFSIDSVNSYKQNQELQNANQRTAEALQRTAESLKAAGQLGVDLDNFKLYVAGKNEEIKATSLSLDKSLAEAQKKTIDLEKISRAIARLKVFEVYAPDYFRLVKHIEALYDSQLNNIIACTLKQPQCDEELGHAFQSALDAEQITVGMSYNNLTDKDFNWSPKCPVREAPYIEEDKIQEATGRWNYHQYRSQYDCVKKALDNTVQSVKEQMGADQTLIYETLHNHP